MRISLTNSQRSFSATPDQSLLDAALAAGLNLPHSCKSGLCGSCRARLMCGEIRYPYGRPLGLTESEQADGFLLMCQARAASDLAIAPTEIRPAGETTIKRLPCRIERAVPLSHDVMALYLRLPIVEDLEFEPGQYIDIMLPGGRRRSFSIASPPHDAKLLELHVRRVPGGEFTERLFHEQTRQSLLNIEGPLGQFVYRPVAAPQPAAPILMVGGGTGLAPLKSIWRHILEQGIDRSITLYWGVRSERDLYAQRELEQLALQASRFRYIPVLSEPQGSWTGRRGWVHEAVLEDFGTLSGFDIYASGPPAMIAAVRREFALRGADPARLFFDSFDYAPDALDRQRTSAATKS
ncbi:MAG: 2Fe-2S iron-sulfur cluster-binding protein [Steroidobacteraceae bacterium]|jgi:CDP-4-dehydro-6-deoxyglucose reductase